MDFDYLKWRNKIWEYLEKFRKTKNEGIYRKKQYGHILFVKTEKDKIDKI